MTDFFIEANGIRHSVCTYGDGEEAIVFLHYLGGMKEDWKTLIPYFENDYHILAVDLRGHGSTDQPNSGYDLTDYSKDIEGILDTLDIQKAHFVGSSFGCDVALRFAYDNPDRALSLNLSEGAMANTAGPLGFFNETKEEHLSRIREQPEMIFDSVQDFFNAMEKEWQPWNEAKARNVRDTPLRRIAGGKWALPTKQDTVIKIIDRLFDEAFEAYYKKITCPVLFLPADKEDFLDKKLRFIEHVKPMLASCVTHIIPDTTHTMMFDNPKEMAKVILTKGMTNDIR